ncbi:hypothetical protein ACXR0O_06280 [Verrucomicrobiota bacterium sgz303538]
MTPLIRRGRRRQGGGKPQGSNTSKLRTARPPSPGHKDGGGICFAESRLYTIGLVHSEAARGGSESPKLVELMAREL